MYESNTPEVIKAAILAAINQSQGRSAMAGGFADGVAGPVSEEISKAYMSLDAVPAMLFVDEGSGAYIDLVGAQYYNITRRAGTRAYCDVRFTGEAGLVIGQGTRFLTAGGLGYALLEQVTLDSAGAGTGRLEAETVGSGYNVDAGSVSRMYVNLPGLASFVCGAAAGGTDEESDAALLARIRERVQRPATSGNGYQYRQWAMEVAGVGNAKVVELAKGAGTVGVTVVDGNYEAPTAELVGAVKDHIEAARPIGAAVTVAGAAALTLSASAQVTLLQGGTAGAVRDAFAAALEEYLHSLIDAKYTPVYYGPEEDAGYTVLYNRVLALLLTTPGVENYASLTLNGGTADVAVAADKIPVLGTVSVT